MRLLTDYPWTDEERAYLIAAVLQGRVEDCPPVVQAGLRYFRVWSPDFLASYATHYHREAYQLLRQFERGERCAS